MTPAPEPAAIDRMFHALADANRRAILEQLCRGPASVSTVARPMQMSLPGVSQHLQILEQAGLIVTRKEGRTRTCSLQPDGLKAVETWVNARRVIWESRFDRLGRLLDEDADDALDR